MQSRKASMRAIKFFGLGMLLLAGLVVVVLLVSKMTRPYTYLGSVFNPPQPAPDFSTLDASGKNFTLSAQKGKIVLLFFGYTDCPDECPTTMATFKQVKAGLGQNGEKVRFILISIDPTRDTSAVLSAYVSQFDPAFTGITGTESVLEPIWQRYGVYVDKTMSAAGNGYTISHSTQVYLIDTQGNLRLTYAYGTSAADILQDIQHLLG